MTISQHLFVINQQLKGLSRNRLNNEALGQNMSISQQSIIDAIRFPHLLSSQLVHKQVRASISTYKRYKAGLHSLELKVSPMQAAASDDSVILQRTGEGFKIQVILDDDISGQAYLMLDLAANYKGQKISKMFLHCDFNEQFSILSLAQSFQAPLRFQSLIEVDSDAFKAITNAQSELFLSY